MDAPGRSVRRICRLFIVLLTGAVLAGCAAVGRTADPFFSSQGTLSYDRKVVRTGEVEVTARDPHASARRAEQAVIGAGGYIEHSVERREGDVHLECRVPSMRLEDLMDAMAGLGEMQHRSISSSDVTSAYTDLESRLKSSIALRDRLQTLLARAGTVSDVLTVEHELTRVRADIERMQSDLERMRSESEMAALDVTLQEQHVPGPVPLLFRGIGWVLSKLFIIQ